MIGDVILWIKKVLKRNSCLHEYKFIYNDRHPYNECIKCGRVINA